MELDEQETSQKLTHKFIINYQTNNQPESVVSPCHHKGTPKKSKCLKKSINPRTPKAQSISYAVAACSSMVSGNNSSLHSISMAVVQTPPAKRYHRVKNPFEAALTERLHLPLIASPSLFQRPNTPQMSSTQFEWTIDEVSSLKPANVEAHETQFQDSPDPEFEAKAQSAINSYFKEQQVVPSPIYCPLRSHRIKLSEINGNTPLSKPGRRIRDCASQTELTLPPVLPPALEEALKPYLQPQLAGVGKEFIKSGWSRTWGSNSTESKDVSLRRKLFDMQNIIVLENENHTTTQHQTTKAFNNSGHSNSSPISLKSLQNTAIVGKLSDSDKSSFGSLSPISARDSLSPNCFTPNGTNRRKRFGNFFSEVEIDMLSPINPPIRRKPLTENNRSEYRPQINDMSNNESATNNSYNEVEEENDRFTPEISSSPLNKMFNNNIAEYSADSFNIKVSRLNVNSAKSQSHIQERIKKIENKSSTESDIFQNEDNEHMLENTVDMDEMLVSELSGHSSNCSSSKSDTPRGKRRSASPKNLSQSFSANWLQDEDEEDLEISQSMKIKEMLAKKHFVHNTTNKTVASFNGVNDQMPINTETNKSSTFYRTDSGFNELSQNSSSSCDVIKSHNVMESGLQSQNEIIA